MLRCSGIWAFLDCNRSGLTLAAGLERDKFDNKTVSFEEHVNLEHNIWNYLYFIVLLREKNRTDYTGPESYVAHMIKVRRSSVPGSALDHQQVANFKARLKKI